MLQTTSGESIKVDPGNELAHPMCIFYTIPFENYKGVFMCCLLCYMSRSCVKI